jgi:hypothetical protein
VWIGPDWDGVDSASAELATAKDADELCRLLLRSQGGWRSSTRHAEAVELLRRVHGTGTLPGSFLAVLLCTCDRWHRVTAKLIAAVEESGLLSGADLDQLAESLVGEVVIEHPLVWVSPEWLGEVLEDGATGIVTIDEQTVAQARRRPEPPLRRWAARRLLAGDAGRLRELLEDADDLTPCHRDAFVHGLLDAAGGIADTDERHRLVKIGLRSGNARVRLTALDRLCELAGPAAARRRAGADHNRLVRAWRPPPTAPARKG